MRQACVALRGGNGWPVRGVVGEEEVEAGSEIHSLNMCCVAGPEKKRARQLRRGYTVLGATCCFSKARAALVYLAVEEARTEGGMEGGGGVPC